MDKPWLKFYEEGVAKTLTYPDATLDTMFSNVARSYGNRRATTFVLKYILGGRLKIGGSLSYRKLDDLVGRFATALHHAGVRKGDRIGLMLPNCPQFVVAFFATMRLGAIVVNINPTYTSREMGIQLEDSGAETIVLLNLFWPRLRDIQTETPLKRAIVTHIYDLLPFPFNLLVRHSQSKEPDAVTIPPDAGVLFFNDLVKQHSPAPPDPQHTPDDVALFQYTGGTTGIPKAAMLSHHNLVANTVQIAEWVSDHKHHHDLERIMGATPFFHVYGLTVCVLLSMYLGGELVMLPNPRPIENLMQVLHKERCSIFPGVPAMYISIVNHPRVSEYDLKSVRACISGSAPLPIEVQEKFDTMTGGRLVEGYGLTEAAPVTHCNPVFGHRKAGSIGIPIPDVEAKTVDLETGETLPPGSETMGELCVRAPQVMKGYWKRPDETTTTVDEDGWLHTGDICKTDTDGYFFIVDRKKDMIITQGFKVLPRDVEEVLFMHPKIQEAAVIGYSLSTRGDEIVKAYIVPIPGCTLTAKEVKDFCKTRLAPYKLPRKIEFREELPKTTVGKVLRRTLLAEELAKQEGQEGLQGSEGQTDNDADNGENGEDR
jgi:long-chain acyl-CoA synthetase